MGKCDTLLTQIKNEGQWTAYTLKIRAERERGTEKKIKRSWIAAKYAIIT